MNFRIRLGASLLAVSLSSAALAPAHAQREDQRRDSESGGRNVAGQFDYYVLALSWSPTYCASREADRDGEQCGPGRRRPYAFVLHGLWPQYERGWPQFCRIRERPFVPRRLINEMLDIMPSDRLVINEYRKHGTCSGLDPQGYYDLSRRLFDKVAIPPRYKDPSENQMVGPDDLVDEFTRLNPGLRPDMLAVVCDGPGNRLREVRVCFSRDGRFQSCGRNENQRRLCSASRMFVPPVREGRAPDRDRGRSAPDRDRRVDEREL